MTLGWTLVLLSASCAAVFIYPYLLYPHVLRLLTKRPLRPAPADLTASLLFCAYNEIECLPSKLDNLRELKRAQPGLQVLAYDDSSTDGTFEFLSRHPELLTVIRGPGRTGKAAGMKRLVEQATGDILVFTDANLMLAPDAIDRLMPYYGDPEVGGMACTIRPEADSASVTSQIGSAYVAIDDRLQQLESATGNVMGATGGLFSVRRALYPDFPDTVQDDFVVSMSVIFQGKRLVKAVDVLAYEKTVAKGEEELRRKIRIGARAYHTHMFLRPQIARMQLRDRFKYVSRKVLRWYGALFLVLSVVFGSAAVATVSPPAAAILVLILAGIAVMSLRASAGYFAKAREIALATFGTFAGVLQGMRGRTFAVWAPAKSR